LRLAPYIQVPRGKYLIGLTMQKFTKTLTEKDAEQATLVAKRIHKLFVEEYPTTDALILACGLFVLQNELRTRYGIEIAGNQPAAH
jgi:hypothetical protein